jgi:hypothetical protein
MLTIFEKDIPQWKLDKLGEYEKRLSEVIDYYFEIACPCIFPRFLQFISVDCLALGGTFHCHESNILIRYMLLKGLEINTNTDNVFARCKVCKSKYHLETDEFGFMIQRMVLTIIDNNVETYGEIESQPMPVFIGPIGKVPENIFLMDSKMEDVIEYLIK